MIYEKLTKIQNELKCAKSRYNSFGKYNYRSLEDILEAVKPLLAKYNVSLFMQDGIEEKAGRFYVKADAYLYDPEDKSVVTTSAYAREEDEKKGMDGSQITGTASSYARKYCLNALFLIDDTKDADTDEYRTETEGKKKAEAKKEEFKKSTSDLPGMVKASDLPSEADKDKFKKLCEVKGLDYTAIIKQSGWEKGAAFTNDHLSKCYEIVRNDNAKG